MCKKSNSGKLIFEGKEIEVDSCLVPLLKSLNKHGIRTIGSCCGHGTKLNFCIAIDLESIEMQILGRRLLLGLRSEEDSKEDKKFFNSIISIKNKNKRRK